MASAAFASSAEVTQALTLRESLEKEDSGHGRLSELREGTRGRAPPCNRILPTNFRDAGDLKLPDSGEPRKNALPKGRPALSSFFGVYSLDALTGSKALVPAVYHVSVAFMLIADFMVSSIFCKRPLLHLQCKR